MTMNIHDMVGHSPTYSHECKSGGELHGERLLLVQYKVRVRTCTVYEWGINGTSVLRCAVDDSCS
jgi:hypothetical protein